MENQKELELLGDECCRKILEKIKDEPKSVKQLDEECSGVSMPTVYRRINKLLEYGLVKESPTVDLSGSHYKTYKLNLKSVNISVGEDEIKVDLFLEDDDLKEVKTAFENAGPKVEDVEQGNNSKPEIVTDINGDEISKLFKRGKDAGGSGSFRESVRKKNRATLTRTNSFFPRASSPSPSIPIPHQPQKLHPANR